MHLLGWTPYLTAGGREDAEHVGEYPVRFTDIDLLDHMNNAVYWSVVADFLSTRPELPASPLRVTLEHEAPIALGDTLVILTLEILPNPTVGAQSTWDIQCRSLCAEWGLFRRVEREHTQHAAVAIPANPAGEDHTEEPSSRPHGSGCGV